jgi:NAD(P)-dependent dehydrogenase (short-subunit alcohol dehydrogenase family)
VGVGLETTRVLAAAGATVIVPARTPEKARAALSGMDHVELEAVELSDPVSVDAFASRFLASGRALHLLIAVPFAKIARGSPKRSFERFARAIRTSSRCPRKARLPACGARRARLSISPFRLTPVAETTYRGALLGRSLPSSTVTLAK